MIGRNITIAAQVVQGLVPQMASVEGIYRAFYTGKGGQGFIVFIVHDGKVAGSDVAGGLFHGTYKLSDEKIAIRSRHQLPAGAQLATDGSTIGPEGFEIDVDVELDLDLGGGKPVRVETQAGPLNIVFQKISEI